MRKVLLPSVTLMLVSLQLWAQQTVSGTVTDKRGNPLQDDMAKGGNFIAATQ